MFGCLLGHAWNGCKCKRCDKARDEQHSWNGCKCRYCDKVRDEQHSWNGCKCRYCDKVRNEQHDWDGCKCKRCQKRHEWEGGTCKRCGEDEDYHVGCQHQWVTVSSYACDPDPAACAGWWSSYRCAVCGATHEGHSGTPLP